MLQRYILLFALGALAACSEPVAPPAQRAAGLDVVIPAARGGEGPRFATLATLDGGDESRPTVSIQASLTFTKTAATLHGTVNWTGTSVTSNAHLIVYDADGKNYGLPVDGYANESYPVPWTGTVYPVAQMAVGKPCGLVGSGSVTAEAIDAAAGFQLASSKGSVPASGYQSACPIGTGGSAGTKGTTTSDTSGGFWMQDCHWVETSYVDSTGSHTTDTYVCTMIYID